MFPLAHIVIGLMVFEIFSSNFEIIDPYAVIIIICSLLPDIIDKSIGATIFRKGHWIGHSLKFVTFIFLLLLLSQVLINIANFGNLILLVTCYISYSLHIVSDILVIPLRNRRIRYFPSIFDMKDTTGYFFGYPYDLLIVFELISLVIIFIQISVSDYSQIILLFLIGTITIYPLLFSIITYFEKYYSKKRI